MSFLRNTMSDPNAFLIGFELVSTRGTMAQPKARRAAALSKELSDCNRINWVSITDNAGGNPQLSPMALGKPILYAGKDVVIHLSCKDFNRNGLESEAWQLASEGFHNILALSGDAPAEGYRGRPKGVFDIDSVGLITLLNEMNRGLGVRTVTNGQPRSAMLESTNFFIGAVTTNIKLHENEVIPQYLKLRKKVECGANFIITQIGYDSKKSHELKTYLDHCGLADLALIGNVFVLSGPMARFFSTGTIPGVVMSDELVRLCQMRAQDADKGEAFFDELAAKQIAIFKGLGYRGIYLGGIQRFARIERILDRYEQFAVDDWKSFTKEISFSRPGEFFLYDVDESRGLIRPGCLNPVYEASLRKRRRPDNVTLTYRLSKLTHDMIFTPGTVLYRFGRRIYNRSKNPRRGPVSLRVLERCSKSLLFGCKDCGDCSLPEIAFRCPESSCAKNQRNGPCGGTRDGQCEVHDFPCIWSIAYDRFKYEGREQNLLDYPPVIQEESLRGSSSWANLFRGIDHHGQASLPQNRAQANDADFQPTPHQKRASQHG